MWTYNDFPKERLKDTYSVTVDDRWLDHLRLSSARLAQGCSASFVSPEGLVMTNHHCALTCVEQLSTPHEDLVSKGFLAAQQTDERRCPELEVNQLVSIKSVTARIETAARGKTGQAFNDAVKAEMSRIEKECAAGEATRCDVVTLYHGGAYDLYEYRRFQDVRLVFAPELAIAFFGGDPDNFNFPRYVYDVAFLRVYQDGKPARLEHHLRWSRTGIKANDVTFVSGHPGGTSRLLTVAQLEYRRDVSLPESLLRLAELRGLLTEYQRRGPEQKRHSGRLLFGVENSLKALRGRHQALLDKDLFAAKVAAERVVREKVMKDPALARRYGDAWESISTALGELEQFRRRYALLEQGQAFSSTLFEHARTLVRAAEELPKALDKRFRELRDSALPAIKQRLFSAAPIHPELEIATLTFSLGKLREQLGPDDPIVRKVLGRETPEALATRCVEGTKLADPALRKRLFEQGKPAIATSNDPMITLARLVDSEARAVRRRYEEKVEAPEKKAAEDVAKARFATADGRSYPDATFTLRINFGRVQGWAEDGRKVPPFTHIGGAFERATGSPPFALPASWLAARQRLEVRTPLNFVSSNDIIGGNSGSPVVDRKGEVVGIIFDGNIHSLGGDFWFDERLNRAISVDSRAILEALRKVYGAPRLVQELVGASGGTQP